MRRWPPALRTATDMCAPPLAGVPFRPGNKRAGGSTWGQHCRQVSSWRAEGASLSGLPEQAARWHHVWVGHNAPPPTHRRRQVRIPASYGHGGHVWGAAGHFGAGAPPSSGGWSHSPEAPPLEPAGPDTAPANLCRNAWSWYVGTAQRGPRAQSGLSARAGPPKACTVPPLVPGPARCAGRFRRLQRVYRDLERVARPGRRLLASPVSDRPWPKQAASPAQSPPWPGVGSPHAPPRDAPRRPGLSHQPR